MNTISSNLDLSSGAISKAIRGEAGEGIQVEISNCYHNKYSDVIETTGHNLSCSYVYHTICPHKGQASKVNANKVFRYSTTLKMYCCDQTQKLSYLVPSNMLRVVYQRSGLET